MGKKNWLAIHPRNFDSEKILHTSTPSCKLGWNFTFQAPARFSSKSHVHPGLLERKKNNNKAGFFFQLNFNVYAEVDNRERARAVRYNVKTKETNFIGRKTWKFYSGGEKMRNANGYLDENECQWKKSKQYTYDISSIKRVTRKFLELEVSLCSHVKQWQMYRKECFHMQSCFFSAN